MKQLFISLLSVFMISWTCARDESAMAAANESCETVVITQQGLGCDLWGIRVEGGKVYPAYNLPPEYRKEGTTACMDYVLFEDMRDCPCCGGTWAEIKSIQ